MKAIVKESFCRSDWYTVSYLQGYDALNLILAREHHSFMVGYALFNKNQPE